MGDTPTTNLPTAPKPLTVQSLFAGENVKEKFTAMLGTKAQGFITSVLQIVNGNDALRAAEPMSIYNAAATAATMDLPINQNLGFAWIVPYAGKAQFQMGYKGFVQLALRTAQYLKMNAIAVYANQFKSWDGLTETLDADFSIDGEGDIVGYAAYFELINGFKKTVYWTKAKVIKHGQKFSKSYNQKGGVWEKDFDSMALKTVLKACISKWGILSIEMQIALKVDQAVIKDFDGVDVEYPDNGDQTAEEKGKNATDKTADAIKKVQEKANGK